MKKLKALSLAAVGIMSRYWFYAVMMFFMAFAFAMVLREDYRLRKQNRRKADD